jgi:hypothetical protein
MYGYSTHMWRPTRVTTTRSFLLLLLKCASPFLSRRSIIVLTFLSIYFFFFHSSPFAKSSSSSLPTPSTPPPPSPSPENVVEENPSTPPGGPLTQICRKVNLPPPDRKKRRVFGIVMFSCSPEARLVIPHFMDHYLNHIGLKPEHMLVTLHTTDLTSTDFLRTKEIMETYGVLLAFTSNEYTAKENYRTLFAWYSSKLVEFTTYDWILPLDMVSLYPQLHLHLLLYITPYLPSPSG